MKDPNGEPMTPEEAAQAIRDGKTVRMTVGASDGDPILLVWRHSDGVESLSIAGWSAGGSEPVCEIDSDYLTNDFLQDRAKLELVDGDHGIPAIEAAYGQKVVAVVLEPNGSVYDHCFNWNTGQNYALSYGRRVVAVADDGSMDIERAQSLYDADRARFIDCFGEGAAQ